MSQIKQILRLTSQGKSIKFITRALSVSRNTVRKYLALQRASGLSVDELLQMEAHRLQQTLLPGQGRSESDRYEELVSNYDYYCKELQRKGVTRWLLWSEYRQRRSDGYCYSQFCKHLQDLDGSKRLTMGNLPHPPGEHLYTDFAGWHAEYTDPHTGQIHRGPILVMTLGYSKYSYIEVLPTQKGEDLMDGLQRGLRFFCGAARMIVPDNMKTAVIQSDRYEPRLNRLFEDLANHYHMAVLPARPGKPKDKPQAESAVRDAYRHVFAPLRNRTFCSLQELNQAVREQLERWHDRPFQGREESRRQLFEQTERDALQPLADKPFHIKKYLTLKARNNCHIELREDRHSYSLPYAYVGQKVQVIYTTHRVQIFHKTELIATHVRNRTRNGYTTNLDHLPENQRAWLQREAGWYRKRGHQISAEVGQLMEQILQARSWLEQSYRSCDGILHLHRRVGTPILTQAARIALQMNCCSYSFVKRLIENGMANHPNTSHSASASRLPDHDNIRGKEYYQPTFKP